jgi:hypothetical protein
MVEPETRKRIVIALKARGCRYLRIVFTLLGVLTVGCFGPVAMHQALVQYDRTDLGAEEDLLLLNIARLARNQPPHFMVLTEVNEQVSLGGSAGFQIAAGGPLGSTLAGPFGASTSESPLFKFVPIEGRDFANRFETTLRDKMVYFAEYETMEASSLLGGRSNPHTFRINTVNLGDLKVNRIEELLNLTARGIVLLDGGSEYSANSWLSNDPASPDWKPKGQGGFADFVDAKFGPGSSLSVDQLQAGQEVGVATKEPTSADMVAALKDGYTWQPKGDHYVLIKITTIPVLTDASMNAPTGTPPPAAPANPVLPSTAKPADLVAALKAGYSWEKEKGGGYALTPLTPSLSAVLASAPLTQWPRAAGLVRDLQPYPESAVYFVLHDPGGKELRGYILIGTLLWTLTRAAEAAVKVPDQRFVGVGSTAPAGTDQSICLNSSTTAWLPADPKGQNADLERERFQMVYKLYQMSLVDTSKLVTSTPITISK